MSTINDTDQFLVQRNNSSFKTNASDLMSTIEDTDLMLIQRGAGSYKVTCEDVKDQLGGGGGGDLTLVNLAPLSGTPEFVVTATTDLAEIFPESVIHYQWYRYTASTGGTGTLVKSFNSDSAILDTYTTTAADQNNYIGCTVTYLGKTVVETERTQCLTAPGPVATMHGLRFDSQRTTRLDRIPSSSISSWTFSCWCKKTRTNTTYNGIFSLDNNNKVIGTESLKYMVYGGVSVNSFGDIVVNTWQHIVVSYDSSTGITEAYVNGVQGFSGTLNMSAAAVALTLGTNNSNPDSEYFDGYLSEAYFVEEVLPPTAFGKNFEPYGWGPLDSSQIIDNIGVYPLSPYEQRANTDQIWSSSLTTSGSWIRGPEEAFKNEGNTNNASASSGLVRTSLAASP